MNKQIKFQKILALVSLIISALVFVFAIIFFSGNLSKSSDNGAGGILAYHSSAGWGYEGADSFIDAGQAFVGVLVVFAIIDILAVATLYITACNKRRNYYITNYVSIGLNIALSAFIGLFILIEMFVLMGLFYGSVDWAGIAETKEMITQLPTVSKSPVMFIIGIVMGLIVLANAAAWTLNLIWKIKLMKGEKELLEKGLVEEVA